ncbi:MAG: hypothetical protein A3K19_19530 [Lentisphaerae bacterium RIFOXYB12_FULL_65_16]|nr:MAG: hypothetical protein A3K18_31285 [Lentisphaerae bacterium RIFOXYA12_64_32]OGV92054.1 MAG: hypothetical protein A3K19_19530 [Lentisphaerae bacterium RIFOXYB12_FULL_65_16]
MSSGLYKMVGGLNGELKRQEAIARNLVGSALSGYKAQHLSGTFQAELETKLGEAQGGQDVTVDRLDTDFSQGTLIQTGRALDLAIHGDGFFRVTTPGGQKYFTRNGQFHLSARGSLITQEGYTLDGKSGPVTLDSRDSVENLRVSENGNVSVITDGVTKTIGQVGIYDIAKRPDLQRKSANYFGLTESRDPSMLKDSRLLNGYREAANASPIQEMAKMVQSLREFEIGQQLVRMQMEMSRDEQQKLAQ